MITSVSSSLEIADLQELLKAARLLETTASFQAGTWCEQTTRAVQEGYRRLGWKRKQEGRWISTPAVAALAAKLMADRAAPGEGNAGGAGNLAGGAGNLAGGAGNLAG